MVKFLSLLNLKKMNEDENATHGSESKKGNKNKEKLDSFVIKGEA